MYGKRLCKRRATALYSTHCEHHCYLPFTNAAGKEGKTERANGRTLTYRKKNRCCKSSLAPAGHKSPQLKQSTKEKVMRQFFFYIPLLAFLILILISFTCMFIVICIPYIPSFIPSATNSSPSLHPTDNGSLDSSASGMSAPHPSLHSLFHLRRSQVRLHTLLPLYGQSTYSPGHLPLLVSRSIPAALHHP